MRKIVCITGASSGIGEATAFLLAKNYDLILLARREDRLDQLALKLKKITKVHTFVLDVRDLSSIEALVENQKKLFSKVQILINNAGLAKGLEPMPRGKIEDWEQMIDTNLKGLLYMTRSLINFMIQNKSGYIINIGSVAGRWVYPGGAVYCATKFAVRAISEALRLDLLGTNIRVTNIEPGKTETEFSLVRFQDEEKAKKAYQGYKALKAQDVAECVEWCINRPEHVNIQEMVVFPTAQASLEHLYQEQAPATISKRKIESKIEIKEIESQLDSQIKRQAKRRKK